MGRRALQRSPKPGNSIPGTPTPSDQNEPASLQSEELAMRGLQAPQSPGGRGLDRVLLERNLERLLSERGGQGHSPDLEKLLLARDRSREPLHLADLSLDDWQPKTVGDDQTNEAVGEKRQNEKEVNSSKEVEETPPHASSMPELAVPCSSESTTGDSATPGSPNKKNRGLLSVRFQGDNEAFEADEGDAASVEASRRFPRSRSYSGRSRHVDTLERRRPRKTTSESHMAGPSRLDEDDADSYCSTCSSSSSSDDLDYQLPPRRAYGGVRISYVPNDALACARRKQAAGYKSPSKSKGSSLDEKDKNCVIS